MDKEKAKALSKTLACYKELQENNSVNLIEFHTADGQKHGIGNPEAIKLLLSVAVIELERQLRTAQFGDIPESLENSREYKAAKQLEYAMNDLERVTKQSYGMIAYAGMSEKLPNLCYYSNDEYSFSKPYSERTAELIDEEVKRMINEQYDRAKAILSEHKDGHNELARLLVEKEVIFAEDVERIFGKRPWTSRSEEIMALEATAKPVEVTEDFEEKNSSDSEEKEKEKKEA